MSYTGLSDLEIVVPGSGGGGTGPQGPPGPPGPGVPTAGSTGQFLMKQSATDFDTRWNAAPVTTVDGRSGTVTLGDKYVDVTGDTMTGPLTVSEMVTVNKAVTDPGPVAYVGLTQSTTLTYSAADATTNTQYGLAASVTKTGPGNASATTLNGLYVSGSVQAGAVSAVNVVSVNRSNTSAGTVPAMAGIAVAAPTGTGPVTNGRGIVIQNQATATTGTAIGIEIVAQTGSTTASVGLAVAACDQAALWISHTTQATSPGGGIAFGSSRDTTLYRDAANSLRTAGAFRALTVAVGASPASTGDIRLSNGVLFNTAAGNTYGFGVGGSMLITMTNAGFVFAEGINIHAGPVTGLKIGTAASQKLGFWNTTPVIQPTGTPAAATDPATTMALINDLRAKLLTIGLIA